MKWRNSSRTMRVRDPRRKLVEKLGYGENWPNQRLKALRRDDFTCQKCGHEGKQVGRRKRWTVAVHHKVKIKNFASTRDGTIDYERANDLSNLITLCPKCHRVADGHDNPKNRGFSYIASKGK
jgi:5-methylcytosine-specific restriction endonuclease McrA